VEDDLDVEGDDTDLRLARLEDLMERRPVAVSPVMIITFARGLWD
jgi:hypothetical protein